MLGARRSGKLVVVSEERANSQITIALLALVIAAMGLILWVAYHNYGISGAQSSDNQTATQTTTPPESTGTQTNQDSSATTSGKVTCEDVTSYDYNWNNDVKCTNPDGSTFYTNYAGGRKYGYDF